MREQSFETRLERVLRTEADTAVRAFDARAIAAVAATARRPIGTWRTTQLLAAALVLLGLLVGAALLVGSLIDRSPAPPRLVLVGRSDGLFVAGSSSSPGSSLIGNRQAVDVDGSPSGRFVATRWLGPTTVYADIVPLDGSRSPLHIATGELMELASVGDEGRSAAALAWAPVAVGGRELLAVLHPLHGLVVLDSVGQVVVDQPMEADVYPSGTGVAWSRAQDGSLAVTWTSGISIWRTTIQPSGQSNTGLVKVLGEVGDRPTSSTYVHQLAVSADGHQIVASVAACRDLCVGNLWLVEETGATSLLTDRVAAESWLSFSDDGQEVLATVVDPQAGASVPAVVAFPVAGGPGVSLDTGPIVADGGFLFARWLPNGQTLLGKLDAAERARTDVPAHSMTFWVLRPGGAMELLADAAFDVDISE